MKANTLLATAAVAWLVALAPVGKFGKGTAYIVAIATSIESVRYSRQLVLQEARRGAMAAMNQEMEVVDLSLQAYSQEQALKEMYGVMPSYSPEIRQELEKSLEHLVQEPSAEHPAESSVSSSQKQLYIAVKSLLEMGKSETYIVKEVLGMGGRSWEKGKQVLQELLQEGEKQGW